MYNFPVFVKAFLAEELPFSLYYAAVGILHQQIMIAIGNPDVQDALRQAVIHLVGLIREDAVDHMLDQLAEPVQEVHEGPAADNLAGMILANP